MTNPPSWLDIDPTNDFSLDNIPFGVFSRPPTLTEPRCCTAIGNQVVDLAIVGEAGLLPCIPNCNGRDFSPTHVFYQSTLNDFMSYPKSVWIAVRNRIIHLFEKDNGELRDNTALRMAAIHPLYDDITTLHLPARIGDVTDFYSSRHHATNVGIMFRGKDNALQPNWLHLPVAYHGRSSSVVVSGTNVIRPSGQLQKDATDPGLGSSYGPSKLLDFELEVAFFVGGCENGSKNSITMENVDDYIFGYVLMNDWSARDIQKWEYVPLGPFGSKNFATSISLWIVTTMALERYRCSPSEGSGYTESSSDPLPLDYLKDPNYSSGLYDINLTVKLKGDNMSGAETVCTSNYNNLYWNARQQLVHHAVTGCNMQPGDLLGSGTISGKEEKSRGCLLELSWRGETEVKLGGSGEVRKFLKDGDTVILDGYCGKDGSGRVGFGRCLGKVLPAGSDRDCSFKDSRQLKQRQVGRFANLKLYGYWLSSATWRVRIALAVLGSSYEYFPIDMLNGDTMEKELTERNPMRQLPVLECDDIHTGQVSRIAQSMAIIEFLQDIFGKHGATLLPSDPLLRAQAREMAEIVNSGTQPLQNTNLLDKIEKQSKGEINAKAFGGNAIRRGLIAVESKVTEMKGIKKNQTSTSAAGPYACGTFAPTIADIFIIPQVMNGRRFEVDVEAICPNLVELYALCSKQSRFVQAHPYNQPDSIPEVVEKMRNAGMN